MHWHCCHCYGTEEQNITYCTKEDTKAEVFGNPSNSGKRNDLDAFKEDVKSGTHDRKQLREDHSEVAARYPKFFDSYILDHVPKVSEDSLPQ